MLGVGAINVLFIPFLVNDLGASPAWAGPLEGAQTLSMILAGGLWAACRPGSASRACSLAASPAWPLCVGLLSIAPGPWALLIVMFAVGWFVMPVQATTMTIVQRATTNETRGRVAGALNAAIQTASIVSMAAAGILADVTGIRVVFAVGGAVALLAAGVAWFLFRGERDAVPTAVARRVPPPSRPSGIETAPASRPAPFACDPAGPIGDQPLRQSPTVVLSRPTTDR